MKRDDMASGKGLRRQKREISEAQFLSKLQKDGWRMGAFGLWVKHERHPNTSVGVTFNYATGKVMYRATLRRLPAELRKLDERAAAQGGK